MKLNEFIVNKFNQVFGRKQEFEELLKAHDIDGVLSHMTSKKDECDMAYKEYVTAGHAILHRPDKVVTNKKTGDRDVEHTAKLPIPYQRIINEFAVVFLYGEPVKWVQRSDGTDDAFQRFTETLDKIHFDAKIRQCKRIAGSETQSALLFRVFQNDEGQADVQTRVLARSKGDEIYVRWDIYESIDAIAWGYYTKETDDNVVHHIDIFTDSTIYRCAQRRMGWDVTEEHNFIGKIPIILFEQEKEWEGVQDMIERIEEVTSRAADVNDYYADPILMLSADYIKNLPDKKTDNKTLFYKGEKNISEIASYLTWDSAPQAKKEEMEWLEMQVFRGSFTPQISLDTLKSLGNLSGKALRTVMMQADIKAAVNKEKHDEMLKRTASLLAAIIGNVLDVSLYKQCKDLKVEHQWAEPFGEDIQADIDNILKTYEGGLLSEETAIEMNPLIADPIREKERIDGEKSEREKRQNDIFGGIDGTEGMQSYSDETTPKQPLNNPNQQPQQ